MADKSLKKHMPVAKTDTEWREMLDSETYRVTRQKGTEAPFTGKYHNTKEQGKYMCSNCGTELFSSEAKFDSGTGWPSLFAPAYDDNIALREDDTHGMVRTEVVCKNCGAHLGHVFNDGPVEKGGQRFCINSCSLNLKKDS